MTEEVGSCRSARRSQALIWPRMLAVTTFELVMCCTRYRLHVSAVMSQVGFCEWTFSTVILPSSPTVTSSPQRRTASSTATHRTSRDEADPSVGPAPVCRPRDGVA